MTEGPEPTSPPPAPDLEPDPGVDPVRERHVLEHLEDSYRQVRERMIEDGTLPPEARDWPL